ncbi:hypothetical protein MYX82_10945 [Acidobacteria bacterium AH-259-D05]|nr:hypothetical protein [Acidobacteria bacterium AH-259-D05]
MNDYTVLPNEENKDPGQRFVAHDFNTWGELDQLQQMLLSSYFQSASQTNFIPWLDIVAARNDVASVALAVMRALSELTVYLGASSQPKTALDLIDRIIAISGNDREGEKSFRIYVTFKPEFKEWALAGKRYDLRGRDEAATDLAGSVHQGFDHQFKTRRTPNLQWNYTDDFNCGDIDVDGFGAFVLNWKPPFFLDYKHFSKYNSDARQWFNRYLEQFGYPGFRVRQSR